MKLRLALLLLCAAAIHWTSMNSAAITPPASGVARELARARAAAISDVRYALRFALAPGNAAVKGHAEIRFHWKQSSDAVVLDFRDLEGAGKTGAITINGRAINDAQNINGHLVLPTAHFKAGENVVALAFETAAAPANRPLIRYQDKDDGSEYVYTLFVPMDASLAFPCFDQPDLKGRFTLELQVPQNWDAISNTQPQQSNNSGTAKTVRFEQTKPISTYLFAFAAGPFKQLAGNAGALPTRLFVRQSQLKRAQEEWPAVMQMTHAGLQHYVSFFGHAVERIAVDLHLNRGCRAHIENPWIGTLAERPDVADHEKGTVGEIKHGR